MGKNKDKGQKPVKQPTQTPGDFLENTRGKTDIHETTDTVNPPRGKPSNKEK